MDVEFSATTNKEVIFECKSGFCAAISLLFNGIWKEKMKHRSYYRSTANREVSEELLVSVKSAVKILESQSGFDAFKRIVIAQQSLYNDILNCDDVFEEEVNKRTEIDFDKGFCSFDKDGLVTWLKRFADFLEQCKANKCGFVLLNTD